MKYFKQHVSTSLLLLAITVALGSSAWAEEDAIEFTAEEQAACLDLDRRNKVLDERCQEIVAGKGTLLEEDTAADDEEKDPDRHSAYERELMKKRAAGGAKPKTTQVQRNSNPK